MSATFRTSISSNQDVVKVFYEMVREDLGTAGSVRCITSDDAEEAVYVRDIVEILNHLDVQHPVGVLVVKVCQGHKDVYGCGVKSLLFLLGQLYKQVKQLMEQGVPLFYIEELLNEAVEDCIHDLHLVTIPVTLAFPSHPQSASPASTTSPPATHNNATREDCPPTGSASPHSGSVDGEDPCAAKGGDSEFQNCGSTPDIRTKEFQNCGSTPDIRTKEFQNCSSTPDIRTKEFQNCDSTPDIRTKVFQNCSSTPDIRTKVFQNCSSTPDIRTKESGQSCSVGLRSPMILDQGKILRDGDEDLNLKPGKFSNMQAVQQASFKTDSSKHHSTESLQVNQFLTLLKGGQFSAGNLNGFLPCVKKPAASTSLHKRVALSSRHLQNSGDVEQDELSSPPVPCSRTTKQMAKSDHDLFVQPQEHLSESCRTAHCVSIPGEPQQSSTDGLRSVLLPEEALVLSHERDEMMAWAREAACRQLLPGGLSKLDIDLIHTRCISGYHGSHRLLHGLVVHADSDVMETISKMSSPVSLLLINGDLTAEFRHKGYKASLSATQVMQAQDFLHRQQQSWHAQVLSLLAKLEVRAVLVRGVVDADLRDQSLAAGIAVVQRIPFPALHALQAACRVDLVTYILDAHEGNVCSGMSLRPLLEDWCDSLQSDHMHLVITAPVFIQTLVICEPSTAGRQMLQEEFWHSAATLAQAVEDGKVLPGGGATEHWCAHRLAHTETDRGRGDLKWPGELSLYRPVVRAALADVFLAYASAVKCNRQRAGLKTDSQQVPVSCNNTSLLPGDSSPCCRRENLSQHAPNICRNTPLLPRSPYSPHPEKPGSHTSCESQNLALEHELQAHKLSPCGGRGCPACAWWHLPHPPRGAGCGRGYRVAICDNYNSKVSGWRSAISCVCSVIKMDTAITTGIDRQTQPAHSVLL